MIISVIIPTRNRAQSLQQSLAALNAQEGAPLFEVIVVDNGSTDETAVALAQSITSYPIKILYEAIANRALARNRGLAIAQGQIVVFIDDDVLVPVHFLRAHAQAHGEHPQSVVSGPILNVASHEHHPRPTVVHHSRAFFCTCNVSVARAAVMAVGGFDNEFSAYGWEDTELGVRLRQAGLQRYFAWQAFVYHLKPPGWESLEAAIRRMREKGQMARRFVRKAGGWRVRLATGDHFFNHLRGALLGAAWTMPLAYRFAQSAQVPQLVRVLARGHYLDGIYRAALRSQPEVDESPAS